MRSDDQLSQQELHQNVGESEVFDLVCDYLRTRQFYQAEKILRDERARYGSTYSNNQRESEAEQSNEASASSRALASRLESMLERSYVTQIVSGDSETPQKIYIPRTPPPDNFSSARSVRSDLDGNRNFVPSVPESIDYCVNTKLVNFEPCKNDPHGSVTMPIYQTSTFAQPSATSFSEYDYTRSGNPTRAALERQITELEDGYASFAFTSGMAAISAVSRLVKSGEEIILSDDSYGGTYRLLSKIAVQNGILVKYVDLSGDLGPKRLQNEISEITKLVMMESPTNPMQRICDIEKLSSVAHANNALLSVDNTMMSPILQNPLKCGADIVIHSATKFICGHSDTMSGLVTAKTAEVAKSIYFYQNAEGTGLAPFDCWLILRGIKTMHLRVLAAQENAVRIASFLNDHPRVKRVYYGGELPETCEERKIHMSQANGFGSVVSFTTGSLACSQHVVSQTKLFKITVSFGSVNSLISLPGLMSHASIPDAVRKAREFPEDLVRLSIGIEDVNDLIRDLNSAFQSFESDE